METNSKKAFMISTVLHMAFFLILFLSALVSVFREKPEPHVFTLVSPPSPVSLPTVDEPPPPTPPAAPEVKDLPPPPVRSRELAAPPTTTYNDFIKKHGIPKTAPPTTQRPSKPVTVPKIDVSGSKSELSSSLNDSSKRNRVIRMPVADQGAIRHYLDLLKDRINRAWQKPASLSGRQFETTVTFSVTPDGHITSLKIIRSSGSEIFDASVRTAFTRVGNVGPTPDGSLYTPTLTFRMIE